MSDEKALIPIEEQTVDFYGDEITTALVDVDGNTTMYIPLRPIRDYLGLSWSDQRERTMRDPVLSKEVALVRVTRTTVKALAELMTSKDPSKNHYQGIFAELCFITLGRKSP